MAENQLSKSGIYSIRNLISGRVYVGSSLNIKVRWKSHRFNLRNGKHPGKAMQQSWDKHGEAVFEFSILELVERPENLIAAEQRWIDELGACDPKLGFNVSPTAGNCLGVKHSAETKARQSEIRRGKPKSPEHRKAIGDAHRGRTIPEERRKRVADGVRRHFAENPEARERMREVGRRNGLASRGRQMSETAKANMSERRKSDPALAAISKANIAKVDPEKLAAAIARRPSLAGTPRREKRAVTFEDAEMIRRLKTEGWTYRRLSQRFELDPASLHSIVHGKTYQKP